MVVGLFALALTLGARDAEGQVWLQDRANMEGAGVRVGDFELHPGIALQGGYDSNYFLRTDNSGSLLINGGVQGTPVMLVTPSFSIATLGSERREGQKDAEPPPVTFRGSLSGTYQEFFGQLTPEQRNGSVDASAFLGILPGRSWGANVTATYDRIIQPSSYANADPDLAFTRDTLTGRAEIVAQPGGGTLDWHLGGAVSGTLFEESGALGYDNLGISAYTLGRWKFRPKTALLYDASLGFSTYTNTGEGSGTVSALHSSDPVRTHLGISGLLSPRVSLLALVGYGGSFFMPPGDASVKQYDSVIANAELKVFLTPPPEDSQGVSLSQSYFAVGYQRDFQTSYLSDFNGIDRGYLKVAYYFAGRAMISLEGGAAAIEYPDLTLVDGSKATSWTDARIDGTLFGEYRFTNWFALNATVKYGTNLSNTVLTIEPDEKYSMQWQRFQAYLGVRAFL